MTIENEIWKDVVGYEGYYKVSNYGRITSLHRNNRLLKQYLTKKGYMSVLLCKNGNNKHGKVHRIVSAAFIDNEQNKPQVNHKNGIRSDNRVENLEWVTAKENVNHSFKVLLRKMDNNRTGKFGILNPSSIKIDKLTKDGVYIESYNSMCEAERLTGVHNSHISKCCNGKSITAGGFRWEFSK